MNALAPVPANSNVAVLAEPPLVIQEGPAALMAAIIQFASNPAMDLDKFDRLIALQERAEDRQAERAFNVAFVRLQGRLPRIKRDGTLEYPVDKNKPDSPMRTVSKYAKWETVDAGIRPILTEEGFGLSFKIAPRPVDGGGLNVSAVLRHIGGHKEIGDPFPVSLDTSGGKNNAQAYGSTLSYGKRYAAFAALNIITEGEDTDGRPPTEDGEIIGRPALAEIRGLIADCSVDPAAIEANERVFLRAMKMDQLRSIEDVQPRDIARLRNALLTKRQVLKERAAFAARTHNGDARP